MPAYLSAYLRACVDSANPGQLKLREPSASRALDRRFATPAGSQARARDRQLVRPTRAKWLVLLGTLLILILPDSADAYPWMIKHRYGGCATCHADPSGGELLTRYGRAQGDLILRMRYGSDDLSAQASDPGEAVSFGKFDSFSSFDEELEEPAPAAERGQTAVEAGEDPSDKTGFLWGLLRPPESVLLGGSYRHLLIYDTAGGLETFPMQMDVYGQVRRKKLRIAASVGLARVPFGSPHARAAQLTTQQGTAWNVISRTHWLGYDFDDNTFLRVGRLNLPFGVRIPEHVSWAREATRTDRESDQHHGIALAFNRFRTRGELMLIAGNYQINPDRFRERGYSLYIEGLFTDNSAFGVSSLFTRVEQDPLTLEEEPTARHAHGVFARLTLADPLVLLAEMDLLLRSRRDTGYVGFAQLDHEIVQGLHFLLTGEVLDAGFHTSAVEDRREERRAGLGLPRLGGWLSLDWFFLRQLELRVDAVLRQNAEMQLLAQLHVYL